MTLRDEAVDLLRRLLRLDTSNPPGNETPAAELLRAHLVDDVGLATRFHVELCRALLGDGGKLT